MPVTLIVGTQWGDEGKGKIVDLLTEGADVVARCQGGHNAGHTIVRGNETIILHLIPSGILHPGKMCLLGNGMVIDPEALIEEITGLQAKGVEVEENLLISKKAHLILPYHWAIDKSSEQQKGPHRIGTTGRGIGPAYADKMARIGIRIEDLMDDALFREKLRQNLKEKNFFLRKLYGASGFSLEDIYRKYMTYRERLSNYIGDVQRFLKEVVKGGKRVLIEGAQGIMLDVDHGTYPFVTSSNSGAGGACTGLGIPPSMIDCVIGVTKAYATRVGQGPFPTELKSGWGDILREKGGEYGATTGRPRRCGWFDVVGVKYATWLNGLDYLAITKVDVLDSFEKISFCVGYLYNGEILEEMPEETRILEACHPVYREMEGWQQNTLGLTSYGELPPQARIYLEEVSRLVGAEIALISTSPNREDVISLQNWW